jgi:hypothetical protein
VNRIKQRLSYANVTATLALFVALGGTSWAALSLPRNSVGSAQIRTGAVGTSELRRSAVRSTDIKDRTIRLADVGLAARAALNGAKGDPGAPGPQGASATPYFAVVNSAGQFVRGNATTGGHTAIGSGTYTVGFARSMNGCAFTATLGTPDATPVSPGRITVHQQGDQIRVQTFDAAGAPADLPFHVIVAC